MAAEPDDKVDVPFDAPWTKNLQHKPDPNHVRTLQTPLPGTQDLSRRPDFVPADSGTSHAGRAPTTGEPRAFDPQANRSPEPSYYDVPMLKPPVWEWMIAAYFYLGGMSGGAYLISRMAERFGGREFKDVTRIGSHVALLSLLPCPPLLIADLGDPKRFHHMLRVFKPSSPMNFGAWVITAYGAPLTQQVIRHYLNSSPSRDAAGHRARLAKLMNNGKLVAISDAAGVPLALLLVSYGGVLLSTTANPLWCKNEFLAPLFSAGGLSTGAEAISLAMDLTTSDRSCERQQRALARVSTLAHFAEAVLMRGFLRRAGEKAAPMTRGSMTWTHHFTTGSHIVAEILKILPAPRFLQKPKRMLAMTLGLAGSATLRWAFTQGGHESGKDPRAARINSRSRAETKMPASKRIAMASARTPGARTPRRSSAQPGRSG